MQEEPDRAGRQDDAQAGQQTGFPENGPDRFPACAESAVEHDEQQGDGTNLFGELLIIEVDGPKACAGK